MGAQTSSNTKAPNCVMKLHGLIAFWYTKTYQCGWLWATHI